MRYCRINWKTATALFVMVMVLFVSSCKSGSSDNVSSESHATPTLSLVAGAIGGTGNQDGIGPSARFNNPYSVAADSSGNVYVADTGNYTIRKITPEGIVTTLAGKAGSSGSADGVGAEARFGGPYGLAVDLTGNIIVADVTNYTIRKVSPAGMVTTLAGTAGLYGSNDGTGAAARFTFPDSVAVDSIGNMYVTEYDTIRKITPAGEVTTLAGTAGISGSDDGTGPAARFEYLKGIAVDRSNNMIYVADMNNNTIRKITPAGVVTTLAGMAGQFGSADGTGADARFKWPIGLTMCSDGNIFVSDNSTIRKITSAGVVTTVAGVDGITGSTDGPGANSRFFCPQGMSADPDGNIYIADQCDNIIRKYAIDDMVTTVAGLPHSPGSSDGAGVEARFASPSGLTVDIAGNIYTADCWNKTIRRITFAGDVSTIAGTPGVYGTSDGVGPTAQFSGPFDVAVDGSGNTYVVDYHAIRKITPERNVSTLAGVAWDIGSSDGHGAAARFRDPRGIAVDLSGNVYVSDEYNYNIRKITPDGDVTTLAGMTEIPGSSDGSGAIAQFYHPLGLSVDGSGNVYVADSGNNTIRKISPAGEVATLAGTAGSSGSSDGIGATARFNNPVDVAVDASGNVYVADKGNYTIRKITPAGVVTTVVGIAGSSATILGPLPTSLGYMNAIAVDKATGDLYISMADAILKVDF